MSGGLSVLFNHDRYREAVEKSKADYPKGRDRILLTLAQKWWGPVNDDPYGLHTGKNTPPLKEPEEEAISLPQAWQIIDKYINMPEFKSPIESFIKQYTLSAGGKTPEEASQQWRKEILPSFGNRIGDREMFDALTVVFHDILDLRNADGDRYTYVTGLNKLIDELSQRRQTPGGQNWKELLAMANNPRAHLHDCQYLLEHRVRDPEFAEAWDDWQELFRLRSNKETLDKAGEKAKDIDVSCQAKPGYRIIHNIIHRLYTQAFPSGEQSERVARVTNCVKKIIAEGKVE